MYNDENVFAKILNGKIPSTIIDSCPQAVAIHDINPRAPIHILILSKKKCVDFDDFVSSSSSKEIADFFQFVHKVGYEATYDEQSKSSNGYRIITNIGPDSCQEVPHFHVHIIAGKKLGQII